MTEKEMKTLKKHLGKNWRIKFKRAAFGGNEILLFPDRYLIQICTGQSLWIFKKWKTIAYINDHYLDSETENVILLNRFEVEFKNLFELALTKAGLNKKVQVLINI